jgi:hypothetical protein
MPTWSEVSLWLDARALEAEKAGEDDMAITLFRMAAFAAEQPRATIGTQIDATQ